MYVLYNDLSLAESQRILSPPSGLDCVIFPESTIPGAPGQDYPTFSTAPATSFDCGGLVQGYYADLETDCQAYHVCGSDPARTAPISTLLCPNGIHQHWVK